MTYRLIHFFLIAFLLVTCTGNNETSNTQINSNTVPIINYTFGNSYLHDTTAFVEGLLMHEGKLYESTGDIEGLPETRSLFGIVNLATGKLDIKVELDRNKFFGEGIAILNGKLYQLTLESRVGFVYDAITFEKIREFTIPTQEGWGITTDGTSLIMSDGTNKLTYLNPTTFQLTKTISVSENGSTRDQLNELEYINGFIYANIWQTNTIVKIDPVNGKVVGKLDLTSLASEAKSIYPGSLEMNGIAYNSKTGSILITGKMWPRIYEITIDLKSRQPPT